jgi:hypothetical protein
MPAEGLSAADYCRLAEECLSLAALTKDPEKASELVKTGDDYLRCAASRRDAPASTASITRSRKSSEYGFGISCAPRGRISDARFVHRRPPGNPFDSSQPEHALTSPKTHQSGHRHRGRHVSRLSDRPSRQVGSGKQEWCAHRRSP